MIALITTSLYFFLPFTLILVLWLYNNYMHLKKREIARLKSLYLEINYEKNNEKKIKIVDTQIKNYKKSTQQKIRNIQVYITNIHFSLHEIFN